jgi:hypothetical protein
MGGELHMPLLVRGTRPVMVGARLLLLLVHQKVDIGLFLLVVVLRLLVGG